jgi:2'-5' RNA ligase
MRIFLALRVSREVEQQCLSAINQLRAAGFQAAWTKSGNFHLTLAFFGERHPVDVDELVQALRNHLAYDSFPLETEKIGFFRKANSLAVLWVGLKKSTLYNALCEAINHSLTDIDFEPIGLEQGHITLGRIKTAPATWKETITGIQLPSVVFPVKEVVLFKSVLSPQGAIYTEIETFLADREL